MESVLQSNQSIEADDNFLVKIGIMKKGESGSGKHRGRKIVNIQQNSENNTIKEKRSMVYIPALDVSCYYYNYYYRACVNILTCVIILFMVTVIAYF